jgi:hypothetical protein
MGDRPVQCGQKSLIVDDRFVYQSVTAGNYNLTGCRDIAVGTVTGYGMDGRGSIPGRGIKRFSVPQCRDRLWGLPSLISSGYRGPFSALKASGV